MNFDNLVIFAFALFVLAVVPGPGVVACVSKSMTSGLRQAVFVIIGIIVADLFFLLMAIFGLAAVAEILGSFFVIVRYLGGLYLIYLGFKFFAGKINGRDLKARKTVSHKSSFLEGFFLTLGNPKPIVFYLSFLPTIIDLKNLNEGDVLVAMITVISVLSSVLITYSFAAHQVRRIFQTTRAARKINKCYGLLMIMAGTSIIVRD